MSIPHFHDHDEAQTRDHKAAVVSAFSIEGSCGLTHFVFASRRPRHVVSLSLRNTALSCPSFIYHLFFRHQFDTCTTTALSIVRVPFVCRGKVIGLRLRPFSTALSVNKSRHPSNYLHTHHTNIILSHHGRPRICCRSCRLLVRT